MTIFILFAALTPLLIGAAHLLQTVRPAAVAAKSNT